jgi:hypothetical protein
LVNDGEVLMPDLGELVCIDGLTRLMLRLNGLEVTCEEPPYAELGQADLVAG